MLLYAIASTLYSVLDLSHPQSRKEALWSYRDAYLPPRFLSAMNSYHLPTDH